MVDVSYRVSDAQWAWRGPEALYRDFDGNATKDETNAAGATFWHIPVRIDSQNPVYIRKKKRISKRHGASSRYLNQIGKNELEKIILTFSGPVYDLSWLHYLTDGVVTADNTPGAGKYTHTYNQNTATLANPPKTFELLNHVINDGTGTSLLLLYTGCTVTNLVLTGNMNEQIIGTWTIEAGNEIVGTLLSSWPGFPNLKIFHMEESVLTYKKGGSARKGKIKSFTYTYKTDKTLDKGGGEGFMSYVQSPNEVVNTLDVGWEPFSLNDIADMRLDPVAANNLDVDIKTSRNETNDYFKIDFPDAYGELNDGAYVNGQLRNDLKIYFNPHESSGNHILTEVNAIDDDRYET